MSEPVTKEGVNTSSFKIAVISALAPVLLVAVLILGIYLIDDARVKEALINALLYFGIPGIIGGSAIGYKYVEKRGDLAVAKVEASQAAKAPSSIDVDISAKSGKEN